MGIPDLLKQYAPLIQHVHLSAFKHKTCAVDMMLWLYKGVYASLNNETLTSSTSPSKSDLYLNYPLKMLSLLKAHEIDVIAVFDGKIPPAKHAEHSNRLSYKAQNMTLAQQLSRLGKEDESKKVFKRTLRIKSRMINSLVDILKKMDIDVVIAPYEADAQISFLYKTRQIDFAISEDSDLIPYGVEHIAFKLDVNGNMEYLDISKEHKEKVLPTLLTKQQEVTKFLLSITRLHLVRFCVMLGCDYIASPKGLGVKSCYKLLRTCGSIDTAVSAMKCSGKYKFENDDEGEYMHRAKQAMSVFYLQTVYDNRENTLRPIWKVQYERKDDSVDDLVTKSFLYDVTCGRKELNERKEKDYYYGPFFEEFEDYCNGNVDVKTMTKDKKKETENVLEKYYNKYYLHLTYANCKVLKWEGECKEGNKHYITIHENKREIDIDNELKFLKDAIGEDELALEPNDNNKGMLLNHKRKCNDNDDEIFKAINVGDILTQTTQVLHINSSSDNDINNKYRWMSVNVKKENECNNNAQKEDLDEHATACDKDLCFKQYKVINDIIIPKKQPISSNNTKN